MRPVRRRLGPVDLGTQPAAPTGCQTPALLTSGMLSIDYASPDPASQLAADEALWLSAEAGDFDAGVFRVWEVASPYIVLGRGSPVAKEVHQVACEADAIPILRRTSGGAAIVSGPGCLMYTVILRHADDSRLTTIDATHDFILNTVATALNSQLAGQGNEVREIQLAGTSDLALRTVDESSADAGNLQKVSGNSMRRGRTCTLYHGTLLYDFDLSLIGRYLATAPRQPDYRVAREHGEFVTNVPLSRDSVVAALHAAWQPAATQSPSPAILQNIDSLVAEKYALESWNLRH